MSVIASVVASGDADRTFAGLSVDGGVLRRAEELMSEVMGVLSTEELAAVCLYVACKEFEVPVMVSEITEVYDVGENDVVSSARCVEGVCGIGVGRVPASVFVDRFVRELSVPERVSGVARALAVRCEEDGVTSGRPSRIVAAVCVYIAAVECFTGRGGKVSKCVSPYDVAEMCGSSTRSVRETRNVGRGGMCVGEVVSSST